ncbi:hypothetical protein [Rubellicoccus peritrichatus]|uniref:Cytochrome C n=1 Tax=Rubellicoccus peritrichatus TaxID=3080537 RepID=A0AAQ3QV28_9BACT|nr:hypothetical protein [Puniceicoccus sp. CR14]WOO43036.1 hypothetical protein RZN69_08015 [Puniceicoccus sp. CR14]
MPSLRIWEREIASCLLGYGILFAILLSPVLNADSTNLNPVDLANLENTYLYADGIYGGSGPYGEADFAALQDAGIKTVVSVDGAYPKIELARKYGLEYIHVPIGYDQVSEEKTAQLVKAMQTREGPFYVHCHHGKHRGPAAAVCMLVGAGKISNDSAVAIMKQVGTSADYTGLYADAQNMTVLEQATIDAAPELREVAEVSELAAVMAQIDIAWDNLVLVREAGWGPVPGHPDIDPAHEALMLNEFFRELVRQREDVDLTEEEMEPFTEYNEWMDESARLSGELEQGIRLDKDGVFLETQFKGLKQSCVLCHEAYRN